MKILVSVAVFVSTLLVSSPATAVPKFDNCWSAPSFNMYADVGEDVYLSDLIASQSFLYEVKRCRFDGFRIEVVRANTPWEVKALKYEVRGMRGSYTPWLYCSTSYDNSRGYVVNWLWYTKSLTAWKGEEERYNKWARDWRKKHGCIRSH